MYYRYWLHLAHHGVYAHYGVRTHRHKLIYFYAEPLGTPGAGDKSMPPEWELFDLYRDGAEMRNVYSDPAYRLTVSALKAELKRLRAELKDQVTPWPEERLH
jgi:hypothetical protein